MSVRVGLVHALEGSIAPIEQELQHQWPEAEALHLYDSSLYSDYRKHGQVTDEIRDRIGALLRHSADAGARGILFTGSLFSRAVEQGREGLDVPVLTAYEAMIEAAFSAGRRLALLATFPDTIEAVRQDIEGYAQRQSTTFALQADLVDGAFDALQGGDLARHDELIVEAAVGITKCDALLLAQHSMSSAAGKIPVRTKPRILTSSRTAVRKLKRLVGNEGWRDSQICPESGRKSPARDPSV